MAYIITGTRGRGTRKKEGGVEGGVSENIGT